MKVLRYTLGLLFIVVIASMVHGPKKLDPEYVRLGNLRNRLRAQLRLLSEIGTCCYCQTLEHWQFEEKEADWTSCQVLKGKHARFCIEKVSKKHYIITPFSMRSSVTLNSRISMGVATLADKVSNDIYLVGFTDGVIDVLAVDDMAYQALIDGKGFVCKFDSKSRCFRFLFPFDTIGIYDGIYDYCPVL